MPYLYGITGIAYNSQYHKNGQNFSWAELWNPAYKNQLLLIDDTRDVFAIALISLGYSANDENPAHIQQAFEKIQKLMPNVKIFNSEAQKMFFIDEAVTLGSAWNGHIYLAHQANPEINMAYPKEGFVFVSTPTAEICTTLHALL